MRCLNCNTTDHEPTAKFCHLCGVELKQVHSVNSEKNDVSNEGVSISTGTLNKKRDKQNKEILFWIMTILFFIIGVLFICFVIYLFFRQFI